MSDAWVRRFVLGVVLIEHGSYRHVVELLRDLFGVALSIGTIHAWVKQAAQRAAGTNQVRDLSGTQFDRTRLKTAVFRGLLALALCYPKTVETEPHPAIQSAVVWRGVAQANV